MLLSFNKSGLMVLRLCWRSYGSMARFKRPIVIPDELQLFLARIEIDNQEYRCLWSCGVVPGQVLGKREDVKISMRPSTNWYHK